MIRRCFVRSKFEPSRYFPLKRCVGTRIEVLPLIPLGKRIYWTAIVTEFDCAVIPVTGSIAVSTIGTAPPGVTPDGT